MANCPTPVASGESMMSPEPGVRWTTRDFALFLNSTLTFDLEYLICLLIGILMKIYDYLTNWFVRVLCICEIY